MQGLLNATVGALGLALLCTATACAPTGDAEPFRVPAHRFVDAPGREAPAATATIRDEQRTVLGKIREATIVGGKRVTIGANARLTLRRELPESLRGAARVVLWPKLRLRGSWERLPVVAVPVRSIGESELVELELDVPRSWVGATGMLYVRGRVPPARAHTRIRSAPVPIAAGATLEFGFGLLEPIAVQGPVRFAVSACRKSDCETLFEERLDAALGMESGWHDRSVSLSELAGSTRSFRFETWREDRDSAAFSLPVWSNPTVFDPRPRREEDWNLLLISIDTLRADRLPLYGYPLDTAPFLQRSFRSEGSVFESLVAASTTTRPSHASLFTSLQPSVHGVVGARTRLPPGVVTLAEALRDHGFETGAATENATLDVRAGMGRGFNEYVENKRRDVSAAEGHIDETLAAGLRWIERNRAQRFFLFLHTYQTHHPYTPPERYDDLFAEPAAGFEPHPALPADWAPALYDREIRYVDDELRRFFGTLEETGLLEKTLIVVTSDHGEGFFEHGFHGHGRSLHGEVLNVPLLMRGPGIPRGLRIAEPVAHVDLMPTLLDLANIQTPDSLMGRSLVPLLREQPQGPAVPVFSETPPRHDPGPGLAVRVGDRKLIRMQTASGVRHLYFDLAADPGERRNRYGEATDETRDLAALLDAHESDVASRGAALRADPAARPEPLGVDPERLEKLRALGYVE